ncbi:MAG: dTDP-4-dehydrorhamnose reductase [candidate division Zixibacteria bacterium]|nr:dTDP-4-dehydrorhamnose reductase [candidate division Zixibacteria bacterium]
MRSTGRVLITGANGLLGQKLCRDFSSSHKVIATDLHPQNFVSFPNFSYEKLDLTDRRAFEFHVRFYNPKVVINAAAYTDVDGCEINKDQAWAVNVGGVKNLVKVCQEHKIRLIHLSTDYIFEGEKGPYSEDDPPHPVSFYGETKLEGENVIRQSGVDFLIVRTNVLYGFGKKVKKNFLLWLIEKLSAGEKIKIVIDQFNNPTLADNLSLCVLEMVRKNLSGVFHIGGAEYLSRYDFALKVAGSFNFNKAGISPTKTESLKQKAKRPFRGGLKTEKAQRILKTKLLNVEESLDQAKQSQKEIEIL